MRVRARPVTAGWEPATRMRLAATRQPPSHLAALTMSPCIGHLLASGEGETAGGGPAQRPRSRPAFDEPVKADLPPPGAAQERRRRPARRPGPPRAPGALQPIAAPFAGAGLRLAL